MRLLLLSLALLASAAAALTPFSTLRSKEEARRAFADVEKSLRLKARGARGGNSCIARYSSCGGLASSAQPRHGLLLPSQPSMRLPEARTVVAALLSRESGKVTGNP